MNKIENILFADERNYCLHSLVSKIYCTLLLISFDGLPPMIEYSGKSLHSTQPPAIMLPFFIVLPGITRT